MNIMKKILGAFAVLAFFFGGASIALGFCKPYIYDGFNLCDTKTSPDCTVDSITQQWVCPVSQATSDPVTNTNCEVGGCGAGFECRAVGSGFSTACVAVSGGSNTGSTGGCTTDAECGSGQRCQASGTGFSSECVAAGGGTSGGGTPLQVSTGQLQNPIKYNNFSDFVAAVLETAVQILMPFVVLAFIWAGFLFVRAQGNEAQLEEAKKAIYWSVIGAFILMGAWGFAQIISTTISTLTQ